MKVKMDLHTHVWEAFNFQPPSLTIAEKVVAQIKSQGIDGIAITDHHNKEWSMEFKDLVDEHFPGEVIIIPGWEIEIRPPRNPFDEYQVSELFLDNGGRFSRNEPRPRPAPGSRPERPAARHHRPCRGSRFVPREASSKVHWNIN